MNHRMTIPRRVVPMIVVEGLIVAVLVYLTVYRLLTDGLVWEMSIYIALIVTLTIGTTWVVNDDRYDRSNALGRWERVTDDPLAQVRQVRNLDGLDWRHHKVPPRIHVCRARSSWIESSPAGEFELEVQQCACGAARTREYMAMPPWGSWTDKNSRRREKTKEG